MAVAHAGEEGPPAYVCEAIEVLQVRRIDHGNRALEDCELVARIAREQLPMTACPLSNRALQVCPDLTRHPLKRMLAAGLLVTVNSDDPSYFGGYVNENFLAIQEALSLTEVEIATLARNSFVASFLPDREKATALAAIRHVSSQVVIALRGWTDAGRHNRRAHASTGGARAVNRASHSEATISARSRLGA